MLLRLASVGTLTQENGRYPRDDRAAQADIRPYLKGNLLDNLIVLKKIKL